MNDLRQAAKMALDALENNLTLIEDYGSKEQLNIHHEAIAALYKTLAQPKQEQEAIEVTKVFWDGSHLMAIPTAPQSKPEQGCAECGVKASDGYALDGYALYCVKCTEPLFKKEWVSLTDDDIVRAANICGGDPMKKIARAIEAKLKEKNE